EILQSKLRDVYQNHRSGLLQRIDGELSEDFEENGFSYFITVKGELEFWSEDATAVDAEMLAKPTSLLKSANAIHEKLSLRKGDTIYYGLILIQQSYPYQNRFLNNQLQEDFTISGIEGIQLEKIENYTIK